jgi:hypothetical protein
LPSFNGYRQVYESLIMHDADYNLLPRLAAAFKWGFPICRPLDASDAAFCRIRQAAEGSKQPLTLPTGAL